MIHGDVEGLFHALADGDGRHHHDELAPTIPLVQLKHGFDVDVGFARACFHFHVQRAAAQVTHQVLGLMDVVFSLDGADIGQQFLGRQTNRFVFVAGIVLGFLRLRWKHGQLFFLGGCIGFRLTFAQVADVGNAALVGLAAEYPDPRCPPRRSGIAGF